MADGIIEVKLSLKGRPIREFAFAEPRVTIGRDPLSHIFLDNPGISRCHAALLREEDGLYLHDQESANGTFLNDEPVRRALVRDGDRVRIGKFLLLLKLDTEQRSEAQVVQRPAFPESTMVLEPAQIERLMLQTRQAEKDAENPPLHAVGSLGSAPHGTTFRTTSRTASSHPPSNTARSAPPLSLHVTSPDSATVSVRRDSRNDRPPLDLHSSGSAAPGTGGFISWLRANAIGIGIGFSAGLAAGILIAKTLLG